MAEPLALIAAWARSAVAPHSGAFRDLAAHDIGAPVLCALLERAGVAPEAVDAVVLGNALGAGGNPARMLALAAGLPDRCAALSVDTQCCAGLDAVALAVGLLASGQAEVVVAGGAEAWTRAPIRQHRPRAANEAPRPYERPAFAPDPARDPDLLQAAADYAAAHRVSRSEQDTYALASHAQAVAHREALAGEIVRVAGLAHDAYPRAMGAAMAARLPVQARGTPASDIDSGLSTLAISPRADGAALVLLMTPQAAARFRVAAKAEWLASASVGDNPAMPLLAAESAAREALQRSAIATATAVDVVELHDAFAVQGLAFCQGLGLPTDRMNRRGGGIARGHPIGASGAVALVRVLADLQQRGHTGATGMAAVAGAGGIGSAAVVRWR